MNVIRIIEVWQRRRKSIKNYSKDSTFRYTYDTIDTIMGLILSDLEFILVDAGFTKTEIKKLIECLVKENS